MRFPILLAKRLWKALGFPNELGQTILFELQVFLVRLTWRWLPRNRATLKRFRQSDSHRLNFGCGDRPLEGFVNVDGLFNPVADLVIDLRRPLPLPDASVAGIYSEHMIEHLRADEALAFLRECHRVLAPGAGIRLIAPDLEGMARAYVEDDGEWFERAFPYLDDSVDAINLIFHQGGAHHFIYDARALVALLRRAGFEQAWPSSFDRTQLDDRSLVQDVDDPLRTIKSVYAEAIR